MTPLGSGDLDPRLKDQKAAEPVDMLLAGTAEVERLTLGPGDVILVRCPGSVDQSILAALSEKLREILPDGTPLAVFDSSMEVTVINVLGALEKQDG